MGCTEEPASQGDPGGELERSRAGEELYRSLVAALDAGVVMHAADGSIQACNASAERILGLSQDQIMGRTSLDPRWHSTHEDGSPFPGHEHPAMVTLRSGEPLSGVIMGVHRVDGTTAWISINTQPLIRAGEAAPYAVVVSFSDITERRRAQQQLERLLQEEQAARQRAAFLAEAGEVLAGSLDVPTTLNAVVQLMVPRLGDLASIDLTNDRGELGPDRLFAVATSDPAQRQLYLELSRRYGLHPASPVYDVLRTGKPRLLRRDDEAPAAPGSPPIDPEHRGVVDRLWFRSVAVTPLIARGQLLGLLGLGATSRELGPADLDLVVELGRRAALALDNARLYQQAQEAVRMRDEFLSIASHELRTPLTTALLNLQRLLRAEKQPEAAQPAALFGMARSVQRQVNRLHRLVEELLDISRITGGQLHLEPEPVDLGALLAEVVERSAEDLRRAGCEVTLAAPPGVVGHWDRLRLDQVITNLLTNAMKYGAGKPIRLALSADDAAVRLAVEDRGIGIAPRDQARIFERFERAVSDRHYGGFGLGLWITRQIVDAMGGAVRVKSALGEGSTFEVELPRRPAQ